ncbi:MAG: C25 family cysteine peptidase [Parafilimonas sp.]
MRKYFLILISCIVCFNVVAQQYYNEWIDYSKTYYKFKIGATGLYRINQTNLPAALQNIPAEQFQLWRNGKQIAVYTSAATGVLPANGYIEFYGQKNDGLPDRNLYKDPNNQLSTDLSLETDTAAYFLTTNAGNNVRITDGVNDVANNHLPADQSFLYHYRYDFQNMLNRGRAVNLGTNVYSSTYDIGEWWSSNEISVGSPFTLNAGNLYSANIGTPQLNVAVAGNSVANGSNRTITVAVNGAVVITSSAILNMNAGVLSGSVSNASISSANTSFTIADKNIQTDDRIVVGFIDLSYQRQFNFGGASQFAFSLPATTQGNFLKITGFIGGHAMLYDLTNNIRYADATGTLQFALPPSASDRNLVLFSEDNAANIGAFEQRIFPDYSVAANQGDYLIISNKILTNVPLSGPVADYVDYRKSSAGGSYNVKVYDIDDLVDEFAYGIKKDPISVKNFLRYARNTFSVAPQFAFLIGKAVTYDQYRINQSSQYAEKLNLVPTFGWPASDNLLSSNDLSPTPATPIGRLSAVTQNEVAIYLSKLKEYEAAQADNTETVANKAWMKTIVHVTGADDPNLNASLSGDLNRYKSIVQDTLFGGNVYSFNKTTSSSGTTILDALMQQLFTSGISLLNYFGHSSASILDYNLNKPEDYANPGKYPVFIVNGCDAGDIFSFDTARFTTFNSLSEAWVLAQHRGSIAYIASTHFGVEGYLNDYNTGFYNSFSRTKYGAPVSYNLKDAVSFLLNNNSGDFIANLHAEESVLHGDPALKINAHALPDFDIEEQNVNIDPTFVSVADNSFKIKCYFYNLGKATGDSVSVLIQRKYPDGSVATLFSQKIKSVRYIDSVELTVPINATRDKGQNSLTITIDNLQQYTELSELNNTVTKQFFIYEDELTPIYPYNFSIVNKSSIKLYASTANAVVPLRAYTMEMDTTELFNSQLKSTQTINSVGGALEFNSTILFADSTVYYWRVAPVPTSGDYLWNTSSFVYLPNTGFGYNQSHLYQHLKSVGDRIYIDSFSRRWTYTNITSTLGMYNAVFSPQYNTPAYFQVAINNSTVTSSSCLGSSIIFNLFDPVTLQPYYNQPVPSTVGNGGSYGGFMNSFSGSCVQKGYQYNFEFHYTDTTTRRQMRDFMDWIPNGLLVTARIIYNTPTSASIWKSDQNIYGVGNTFYDRLKQAGFSTIDSFENRIWVFDYEKNNSLYVPGWQFSQTLRDLINYQRYVISSDTLGFITSPAFGPAKAWHKVLWNGNSVDAKPGDQPRVDVIGVDTLNNETLLYSLNSSQQNFDISSVNVAKYPYIKLKMRNADSINLTPYQLRWWRLLYDPVPEGALAPNILYKFRDTVAVGETDSLAIAFKNVSEVPFADSILVNLTVYDASNNANVISIKKLKALNAGDTAIIMANIATTTLSGLNNLYLDVNPNNNQPEQTHFNNFLYRSFAVNTDNYKPTLDVTFDGIHILNNDIVAAKPHVLVKMKDESGYLLLNDTSLVTVQLRYPDGTLKPFYFNTDTLLFTPATSGSNNVASVDFTPYLTDDGTYQLIIHGKDKTGNTAGNVDYMVSFEVYNKPMITNMFNYPNPFTTSTAFVFTITGSEVPQNIRIEILTITGKIVKEITKEELGSSLHIGRNITDYKWDGKDEYGQKLANGVYLYRVLTNLNGKSLDKFPTYGQDGYEVNTDKYFNKGYGKMYLMR